MPSETFYRLPESKQERILNVLKDEIARSSYEDFSIGTVLRESGISRGSFYQYFHNKEEIFLYFLAGYQKSILSHANVSLEKHSGDFFESFLDTYRYAVRMLCYKDSRAFRHNLFCNLELHEKLWKHTDQIEECCRSIRTFLDGVDLDLLTVNSREELRTLADICFVCAVKDSSGLLLADDSEEKAVQKFTEKFALLRRAYSA